MLATIAFLGVISLIYVRVQLKHALNEQSPHKRMTMLERIELDLGLQILVLSIFACVGLINFLM